MSMGIVWQDYEEKFILKKEDVFEFLRQGVQELEKTGDYDAEDLDGFRTQNGIILNKIKRVKDDLIGLYVHPMTGWFVLNQKLVSDYRKGEI